MPIENNYPNPLDNFRSYSYHFILTVSSSTESFRKMVGANNPTPLHSRVNDVALGGKIDLGEGDNAYLVIDTRRFSQFAITEYESEHAYGTGTGDNPSVPITTTRMKVIDTTGLTFFNFMMDLFRNKIHSTRASAFFLLNIVFVGHNDDDSTEIISTAYIPLLLMMMDFTFTHSGSVFNIEFMETEGSFGRSTMMSHLEEMGSSLTINTQGKENNVSGMIRALEEKLNTTSLEFYQDYINTNITRAGKQVSDTGKLVQYMINIPSNANIGQDWTKFKLSTTAHSKYDEQRFPSRSPPKSSDDEEEKAPATPKNTLTRTAAYSQMTFAPNTTVSDAINQILNSAEEVLDLGSEKRRKEGTAVVYKIVTNITSDDTTYLIHFDVYPYHAPKLNDKGEIEAGGPKASKVVGNADIVKNVISYDYIFTGKNSHIQDLKIAYLPESSIALDMNLDLGGGRMAANAAAGQDATEVKNASKTRRSANDSTSLIRKNDPIIATVKTKANASNNTSQVTENLGHEKSVELLSKQQEYNKTMAYLHFLGSLELTMTVRGNPNIIRKYANRDDRGGFPRHSQGKLISTQQIESFTKVDNATNRVNFKSTLSSNLDTARRLYVEEYYNKKMGGNNEKVAGDALLNGVDIVSLPVFVKVNIMAPNVDFTGQNVEGLDLFTNEMFYRGFYQVLTIRHTLIDGTFQHEMTLIPYDVDGSMTKSGDDDTSKANKQV